MAQIDAKLEVVRFAVSTAAAGGTQDVTISGFGTPKAAIFIFNEAVTDGVITGNSHFGVGFTDGTRQNAVSVSNEDAVASSNNGRTHRIDRCISFVQAVTSSAAEIAGFSFNSFITDGIRLDIDLQSPSAFLVTCILIGGADVTNVHCDHKDDLGGSAGAQDITDPGFEPDLVFMTCMGDSSVPTSFGGHNIFSFGVGHNDGSDTQRSMMMGSRDAQAATLATGYLGNDSIVGQIFNDALNWDGVIGVYDANGFSITTNAGSGNDIAFYLALKFSANADIKLFDMEWPTSGNYAQTDVGFTPNFGMLTSIVGVTSRNTPINTGVLGLSVATFDDAGIITLNSTDEDAATTTVSKSMSASELRVLDKDGSTNAVVASSFSFDQQGWDFTLSTNPGTAVLGWGLAFGIGESPAILTATSQSYTVTGIVAGLSFGKTLTATSQAFTLTGNGASLLRDLPLIADTAAYTLTGIVAGLSFGKTLTATQQSYSLTGDASGLEVSFTVQTTEFLSFYAEHDEAEGNDLGFYDDSC